MRMTFKTYLAAAAASVALMAAPAWAQTSPPPEQAPTQTDSAQCAAGPVTADMLCAPAAEPAGVVDPARDPMATADVTTADPYAPSAVESASAPTQAETVHADVSNVEGWDGADLAEAPTAIQNAVDEGNYTSEDLNRAMLAALQAEASAS